MLTIFLVSFVIVFLLLLGVMGGIAAIAASLSSDPSSPGLETGDLIGVLAIAAGVALLMALALCGVLALIGG